MAVEDNAISLISDDGDAELRLEFTSKTEFGYGESRRSETTLSYMNRCCWYFSGT
jgi:hypothetical protein